MLEVEVIKAKREVLKTQFKYCETLLQNLYTNFDKTKLRNQMAIMKMEIDTLTYVLDDAEDLPF